jgi:hypothetical protein
VGSVDRCQRSPFLRWQQGGATGVDGGKSGGLDHREHRRLAGVATLRIDILTLLSNTRR